MPAPDGGDDFFGICDPLERFGLGVVVFEETIVTDTTAPPRAPDALTGRRPAKGVDAEIGEEVWTGREWD